MLRLLLVLAALVIPAVRADAHFLFVHVPTGHSGMVIDGPSEGEAFSLKVNDLRVR